MAQYEYMIAVLSKQYFAEISDTIEAVNPENLASLDINTYSDDEHDDLTIIEYSIHNHEQVIALNRKIIEQSFKYKEYDMVHSLEIIQSYCGAIHILFQSDFSHFFTGASLDKWLEFPEKCVLSFTRDSCEFDKERLLKNISESYKAAYRRRNVKGRVYDYDLANFKAAIKNGLHVTNCLDAVFVMTVRSIGSYLIW